MTTHPEVPQATAREEAIAVVSKMLPTNLNYDWAAEILEALLLPRTVPCPEPDCVDGWVAWGSGDQWREEGSDRCNKCVDGSVTLAPLAVLVGELERVEFVSSGLGPGGWRQVITPSEPLFRAPFIEAQREEA